MPSDLAGHRERDRGAVAAGPLARALKVEVATPSVTLTLRCSMLTILGGENKMKFLFIIRLSI